MKKVIFGLCSLLAWPAMAEQVEYEIVGENSHGEVKIVVSFDDEDPGLLETSENAFSIPSGALTVSVSGNEYTYSSVSMNFFRGADYTGFTINAGDGPDYFEFHSGVNGYSLLNSVPTEFSPGEYVLSGSYIVTSNYIPELYEGLYPHIDPTLSASYVDDAQAPESPSVLTFTGEGSNGQPVELSIHFDPDSPDFVTTEQSWGVVMYDMPSATVVVSDNGFEFELTGASLEISESWGNFFLTSNDNAVGNIDFYGQATDLTMFDLASSTPVQSVVTDATLQANQHVSPYFHINQTFADLPHLSSAPTLSLDINSGSSCSTGDQVEYTVNSYNEFGPLSVVVSYPQADLVDISDGATQYAFEADTAVIDIVNGPLLMTLDGVRLAFRPMEPAGNALSIETMQSVDSQLEQFRLDVSNVMSPEFAPGDSGSAAPVTVDALYSIFSNSSYWFEAGKLFGASVSKNVVPVQCN